MRFDCPACGEKNTVIVEEATNYVLEMNLTISNNMCAHCFHCNTKWRNSI